MLIGVTRCTDDEQWKPVVGYEGLYEVSDKGRVKSFHKPFRECGRILKAVVQSTGYETVDLRGRGITGYVGIHRLVLEAFVGDPPEDKTYACHIDDNKRNNALSNLYWGSPLDNSRDASRNIRYPAQKRSGCPQGHPYTGDNILWTREGHRRCRECNRVRCSTRYRNWKNAQHN